MGGEVVEGLSKVGREGKGTEVEKRQEYVDPAEMGHIRAYPCTYMAFKQLPSLSKD